MSGRHSRAARKLRTARLRATVDTLTDANRLISKRVIAGIEHENALSGLLRTTQIELEREQRANHQAMTFQRRVIEMVETGCTAHQVPVSEALRNVARDARQIHVERWRLEPHPGRQRYDNSGLPAAAAVQVEVMNLLRLRAVREHMNRSLHLRVHVGDRQAGYAISEDTLKHQSAEHITELIAGELALHVTREIKRAYDAPPPFRAQPYGHYMSY